MALPTSTIVRVLEFGRVTLPERWNTASIRERLEKAALNAGVRAFEIRGRALYALGVVGVIDLGGLIVEILPKTHDDCTPADAAIFLSELLRFSGPIENLSISEARVAASERTLLEIVMAWAVREAAINIREGLPRRYEVREELSTAVRGRIELRYLTRRPPGKDFELLLRHAPLSENNQISRIIKWLLQIVGGRTRFSSTRQICRRLLQGELEAVNSITPQLDDLNRLALQQTDARWQPLLNLVRLFLCQVSPDPTRAGIHDAVAVLFTLHDLFQRVLGQVFKTGLSVHDLVLRRPNRRLLQALPPKSDHLLTLKPDFLFGFVNQPEPALIGDAKWKRILNSDGTVSLGEADAYQLTTYLAVFGVPAGFIFAPLPSQPADEFITVRRFRVGGLDKTLIVIGIHLPTLIAATPVGAATRKALCARVATHSQLNGIAAA